MYINSYTLRHLHWPRDLWPLVQNFKHFARSIYRPIVPFDVYFETYKGNLTMSNESLQLCCGLGFWTDRRHKNFSLALNVEIWVSLRLRSTKCKRSSKFSNDKPKRPLKPGKELHHTLHCRQSTIRGCTDILTSSRKFALSETLAHKRDVSPDGGRRVGTPRQSPERLWLHGTICTS